MSATLKILHVFAWVVFGPLALQGTRAQTPSELQQQLVDRMIESVNPHSSRNLQSLLIRPDVQAEVGVGRDAYMLIRQAQQEIREQESELIKTRPDFNDREAIQEHFQQMLALRAQREKRTDEAIAELLPPEPFKRLKQIAYWVQIEEAGLANVLLYGPLSKAIGLTESEVSELAEKAADLEAEKQAKIDKLIAEYDGKLLKNLKTQQRKKLEEVLGQPFEYEVINPTRNNFEQVKQAMERQRAAEVSNEF